MFCTLVGLSGWAVTALQQGLPLTDLAPDGSYSIAYQERNDKYFGGLTYELFQVIDAPEFDYSSHENQKLIEQLTNELDQLEFIVLFF